MKIRFDNIENEYTACVIGGGDQGSVGNLLSTRITRAKELLVLTDFSVCEIAHQVGFGDESNFSTRFTAMVGQSPQQYRKSAMKPAEN